MFSLWGREIDNSIYFTLYKLWQVADSFKQIKPYHLPIHYDRTKVAIRIYTMISNNGLVAIRKIEGDTYITVTEKGDDVSTQLLQALIAFEELTNCMDKTDSDEPFKVKKGVGYDPGLKSASCLSDVFTYAILAVAETYFPGINSDSVSCGLGCCHEG
jgi:hypothetical protein